MKRLLQEIDRLRCLLLRWVPAGVWFACTAMALITIGGWIDPFGLRQRLDWIVSDQFLRFRQAPPIHHDLLVVAIDDNSVEQFGFPLPRSVLAGVIRQLSKLEARTVLVDILFAEPQRKPVLDEANMWLLPAGSVMSSEVLGERFSELKQRFSEDQVLARAVRPAGSVVIPLSFLSRETLAGASGANRSLDEALLARMSDALQARCDLGPAPLAAQLGVDVNRVRPLFAPALELAMDRLARQQIERNPTWSVDDAVADALPIGLRDSYVEFTLRRAFDRASAEKAVLEKSAQQVQKDAAIGSTLAADELRPPRHVLADAAAAHGFADLQLDSDGTVRRVPLVGRYKNHRLFHQSLVALLVHQRVSLDEIRVHHGLIQSASGTIRIPVDSSIRLTVDWPTDRLHRWSEVMTMIPLADIQQLDQYELDLNLNRHRRRESFKEMAKLAAKDPAWEEQFQAILTAHRQGRLEEARALESHFDKELLPQIEGMSAVQEAFERARTTDRPGPEEASEPGIVQYARAILDIDAALGEAEPGYQAAFRELLPMVRGKLCLIGDTTTGSTDLKRTPVEEAMPGVAVIAAAVNTMLAGSSLTFYGYGPAALVLIVIGAGLMGPQLRLDALSAGACTLAGMLTAFFGSYLLLSNASIFVSPVTPVVGLAATYLTITTYQWLREYREKRLVRTIFEAQTNPAIVERLIEAGHAGVAEVLAPKNRQLTVFFAEIADYDELARQVTPERLPELLSRTFGTMAKLVLAHEGTLDRYQGHAMVAFFGAPVYQSDHAQRACRAALECCDTLGSLAPAWQQRGLQAPRVHVGLHTGELLVGNITLTSRVDYTVAGENLNVAYRIGELNEIYGTQIMMSESTLTRCENMVEARELDMVRIKGRREPIRAFELMSAKGRLTHDQMQLRGTFSTGLIAFRNKDFAGALAMFRSCRETAPRDRPATVYIERCERELSATVGAGTGAQGASV